MSAAGRFWGTLDGLRWIVGQYKAGAELVMCPRYLAEHAIEIIHQLNEEVTILQNAVEDLSHTRPSSNTSGEVRARANRALDKLRALNAEES